MYVLAGVRIAEDLAIAKSSVDVTPLSETDDGMSSEFEKTNPTNLLTSFVLCGVVLVVTPELTVTVQRVSAGKDPDTVNCSVAVAEPEFEPTTANDADAQLSVTGVARVPK